MALANYTDLQASIAGWLHRSDLTSIIPDFIALAESRMARDLPEKSLYTSEAFGTVSGTEGYSTPNSMIGIVRVWITDSDGNINTLPQINPATTRDGRQGKPVAYSIDGNQVKFAPIPDAAYTITIDYKRTVLSLATNNVNDLLTKYPDMYLNACLVEACQYTNDRTNLEIYEGRYQVARQTVVDSVNHNRLAILTTDLPTVGGFDITTGV